MGTGDAMPGRVSHLEQMVGKPIEYRRNGDVAPGFDPMFGIAIFAVTEKIWHGPAGMTSEKSVRQ
ncbi:hypothetical protein [Nocardia sp. NBC_01327]|uniref:hypothetical protein n=1 Tax=Nocardia sp. NBC_01327 TaxID=2903593 RepID=UPI002E152C9B|nr:hypothetical protein OG326_29500 [Nocardia sp. NBC_01327]